MLYFTLIVYGALLATLLVGCRFNFNGNVNRGGVEFFYNMNALRGIFAIEIVLGHAVHYSGNTMLFMLGEFMFIGVSFFFFASAFGMARSYDLKPDYMRGFLIKKCGTLFSIAMVCFLQNELIRFILHKNLGWTGNVFSCIFEDTNWYIWELMLFYILFWAVYSFVKKRKVLWTSILVVIIVHIMYFAHFDIPFYISAIGFLMGLLFYTYYEKSVRFFRSTKGIFTIAVTTAVGLCSMLWDGNIFASVYLRNIMCAAFLSALVVVLQFVRFDNAVLRFLSKYSAEIYFYQFIYLEIFANRGTIEKTLLIVGSTLITAVVMRPVNVFIKGLFQKGFNKARQN